MYIWRKAVLGVEGILAIRGCPDRPVAMVNRFNLNMFVLKPGLRLHKYSSHVVRFGPDSCCRKLFHVKLSTP